jgi:hypothetical protein
VFRSEGSKSACNICVGFADVTRASGVNLAQMLHTKFVYDVRPHSKFCHGLPFCLDTTMHGY